MDTMRAEIIMDIVNNNSKTEFYTQSSLLIGEAGTQKTSSIILYAEGKKGQMLFKRLNFSSATTPLTF